MAIQTKRVEKATGVEHGHIWHDDKGGAHVEIVSIAPYPLMIPVLRKVGDAEIELGKIKLMPGQNVISEDDWNAVRDLPLVKKRLDERWLQVGRLTKSHKYELTETNKSRMIEEHCAKAKEVKFDISEVSDDRNLRQITG